MRSNTPNALCIFLLLSLCTNRIEGKGEVLNPAIAALGMREECLNNVNTRPCPLTRPQAQLDADQYPPDYFCPCPVNGLQQQGAVPNATGVPCPPNPERVLFQDYVLAEGFIRPLIMEFTDNTNELFVGTRDGVVEYINLGTGERHLVVDLSYEISWYGDRGLMDIETSPNYNETRYIYMMFTTDSKPDDGIEPHMDEASNQRVIRFTDSGSGFVDIDSRYTLIGEGEWDGIPTCFSSHSVGSMEFGWDGSLFISTGEGAHWDYQMVGDYGQNTPYSVDPFTSQRIPSRDIECSNFGVDQDVGAFRSQIHYSLGGKILRITPEGDGVCEGGRGADQYPTKNPFCDDSNGQSIASKIWALGVRNPFRMTIRPKLPTDDPTYPGVLYFGDVGQTGYEEINVCNRPGMNFGWPCWEGPLPTPTYRDSVYNGPDPFNIVSYGCPEPGDLCGPIESIPYLPNGDRLTCPYMYQNMTVDMPFFYYNRYPITDELGYWGDSAFLNQNFLGASTAGITFYNGDSYPSKYHGAIFILEFSFKWIRVLFRTDDDRYERMQHFADLVFTPPADGGKANLVTDPRTGDVCYAAIDAGELRCFRYITDNIAPDPYISYSQPDRTKPRTVHFSSDGTFDRENDEMLLEWNFGDGEISFDPNPVHVYASTGEFTVILTATDSHGNSESATKVISTANLPPLVRIVNPVPEWEKFVVVPDDTMISFECEVEDDSPADTLQYRWEFQFVHNNHIHTDQLNIFQETFQMNSMALPKEAAAERERANLRIVLHVTDEGGLEGSDFIRVSHEDWEEKFPNQPPIPDFSQSLGIQPSITGQPVRFSAQRTVEPNQDRIDFYWDFGDGFLSTGETTTHVFQGPTNTRTVTLTTTDNFGATSFTTQVVSFEGFTAPCSAVAISEDGEFLCVNNARSLGSLGNVTIPSVSAASLNPPPRINDSLVYEMGPFDGDKAQGATSLHLFASSESGNAQVKVRISFDFTADGSWDRVEDFGPFPVSADWTELTGDPTTQGTWRKMVKGLIRLQIWQSSVDTKPVYLRTGSPRGGVFSRIALPHEDTRLHDKPEIQTTQTSEQTESSTTGAKPSQDDSTAPALVAHLGLILFTFVLSSC